MFLNGYRIGPLDRLNRNLLVKTGLNLKQWIKFRERTPKRLLVSLPPTSDIQSSDFCTHPSSSSNKLHEGSPPSLYPGQKLEELYPPLLRILSSFGFNLKSEALFALHVLFMRPVQFNLSVILYNSG